MKLVAAALVALLSVASAAHAGTWQRPVRGPLLRTFALSADRYAAGQHRGVDLAARPGATVRAACAGRVRFTGSVPGGGRTVSVACGALVATYGHLGAVAVRRGQLLPAGATVGSVGRSGRPRAPRAHLHLGAREAASGRYVDPMTLFGPAPRLVPPLGSVRRRPLPPAPVPAPAARRLAPVRLTLPQPPASAVEGGDAPAPRPALVVWAGLAMFGLGLPLGGLLRRQRRRRSRAAAARRAGGWAPAHR